MKPRIQVKSSIALAVILAAPRLGAVESSAPKVSEKQLQALTSNAKTPEDHQKLADYYRQQAKAFAQKSKEHTEMPERWPVLACRSSPVSLRATAATSPNSMPVRPGMLRRWLRTTKTWPKRQPRSKSQLVGHGTRGRANKSPPHSNPVHSCKNRPATRAPFPSP